MVWMTTVILPLDLAHCMTAAMTLATPMVSTVKLGNKERFDKEQIGIKEPFPVTNLPFTS